MSVENSQPTEKEQSDLEQTPVKPEPQRPSFPAEFIACQETRALFEALNCINP